jgi:hypothetical protein
VIGCPGLTLLTERVAFVLRKSTCSTNSKQQIYFLII